ncbi:MAG: recombination mediator RecR [Desulfobulbus sp.]|jgi:recombination protein RecR|uniref:recombination mediator RecR n=1 Tax=Desulfobulbus sp. TaxID=895 RepID=UPI00284F31D1|nr:recombination mediator RecR [Desulfobulbus sp.]MDR2551026.1 recombination mediator RecR [Desulfobulbus sp.]
MQVIPPALERLIGDLTKLPGIGRKSATRLALYILRRPAVDARNLADDLLALHEAIRLCRHCFTFSETDPCAICGDPSRTPRLVCVVEEPGDQIAIERTGAFRGVYHILHGVIAPMDGIGPAELKIRELRQRVASGRVDEVLLATSSTVPGEATASYLAELLKDSHVRISRLACGIPMGMDIKYADEHTLAKAIESRQPLKPLV